MEKAIRDGGDGEGSKKYLDANRLIRGKTLEIGSDGAVHWPDGRLAAAGIAYLAPGPLGWRAQLSFRVCLHVCWSNI